jgi:hypothetical protein
MGDPIGVSRGRVDEGLGVKIGTIIGCWLWGAMEEVLLTFKFMLKKPSDFLAPNV